MGRATAPRMIPPPRGRDKARRPACPFRTVRPHPGHPHDAGTMRRMNDQPLPYATPAPATPHPPRRQAFGVIVRTIGVLLVLYGIHALLTPVYAWSGMSYQGDGLMPENYAIEGATAAVLGALLIRGGWLVRLAYGRND